MSAVPDQPPVDVAHQRKVGTEPVSSTSCGLVRRGRSGQIADYECSGVCAASEFLCAVDRAVWDVRPRANVAQHDVRETRSGGSLWSRGETESRTLAPLRASERDLPTPSASTVQW